MNSQEIQIIVSYVNELLALMRKGIELDAETRKMLIEANPQIFLELRKAELESGSKAFDRLANSIDNLVATAIPMAANAQKEMAQARVIESNNNLTSARIQADVQLKELNRKIESERRQRQQRQQQERQQERDNTNGTSNGYW